MKKKIIKKEMIFKLVTKDWNKLQKKDQDEALLFMFRVLAELSEQRKTGYSKDFWAQYP